MYNSNRIAELQGDRNCESGYPARPRPLDFDGWPGFAPQLEEEQTELHGIRAELEWRRINRPSPLPAGDDAVIWRQLWARVRESPLRTQDCVYIIAKQLLKGWEIVKVGEAGKVELLLDRKVSWGSRHRGRPYRELVIRHGYTLFWAPTTLRERKPLQLLIARILLRVTNLTGHDQPRAVITRVNAPVDVRNVLPLELAEYALRSFEGQGTVEVTRRLRGGVVTTRTNFVKYPRHLGRDVLDGRHRITLAVATDHAF